MASLSNALHKAAFWPYTKGGEFYKVKMPVRLIATTQTGSARTNPGYIYV